MCLSYFVYVHPIPPALQQAYAIVEVPDNRPNRQIDPWFKPSYHYHRTISIRFVDRDPSTVRNLQPVFHFAVLVHKTPFTLPLLRVGVERFLPRLVISFEPVSRQN
jgi:hypothetical protein